MTPTKSFLIKFNGTTIWGCIANNKIDAINQTAKRFDINMTFNRVMNCNDGALKFENQVYIFPIRYGYLTIHSQ